MAGDAVVLAFLLAGQPAFDPVKAVAGFLRIWLIGALPLFPVHTGQLLNLLPQICVQ